MRAVVAVLAFGAVTVATYLIAHVRIFLGFASYDDEGYMLTALGSFIDHGSLYDDVFTQYGPFYFATWGGLFSGLGLSVDHESGRLVTMGAWVVTSLAIGLATWRIAASMLVGLFVQILVFGSLIVLVNEPMHPGGLIALLLAAIVAISAFVRERVSVEAMALLGASVAALALVKINLGVFAVAAVALVCVVSYPALPGRRWLRPLVEVGFVALPLFLILSKADQSWARHYGVHVAVAAAALVIVLRARSNPRRSNEELPWLLGGFVVFGAAVLLTIAATGTSPGGIVEGVITQPLRQSDAFSIPLGLSSRSWLLDLIAFGGAAAYCFVARARDESRGDAGVAIASLLSIAVGLTMALSVVGRTPLYDVIAFPGFQFEMLAFAWVALIPLPGASRPRVEFARMLLPALAVLQSLHAFPVAGSQVAWSTMLLIPVGGLCLANGVRGLSHSLGPGRVRVALGSLAALAALVLGIVLLNQQLREPYDEYTAIYDGSTRLELPGAEDIRMSPEEAETYGKVVTAIDRNCASFLMLPGMDSFYLWTEQDPPTLQNATGWPTLFDDEREQRVIDETSSIEGLCLLRNIGQAEAWSAGEVPDSPLVRYLETGFAPVTTIGPYELLKREAAA